MPARILAIDPGTRYMGVAVLVGGDLIRADVESIREAGMSPGEILMKAERIVRRWIARYRPQVLAVEKTFFAQSKRSHLLNQSVKAIKALGRREGLIVREYPPTTVRRYLCDNGRATKMGAARVIATEHFPWLYPNYQKEAIKAWWRQRYWTNMFDAIGVGLTCYGESADERAERQAA